MDEAFVETHRAGASEDDWRSVKNAKKRKQIQDRLAQRARRKRLREANNYIEDSCRHVPNSATLVGLPEISDMIPSLGYRIAPTSSSPPGFSFGPFCEDQTPRPSCALTFPPTVISALYINGQILGLSCCTVVPARSAPVSADVPSSLQPTQTQLLTIHASGIDRFPFPRMRDNMIHMGAIIDDEEFSSHIFTQPSFTIMPGRAPWDPKAWKIEKPFSEKWGFLFY